MTEEMHILGFDPGMGAIKLYGPNGSVELPSQVAVATGPRLMVAAGLKLSRKHVPEVEIAQGKFLVGAGAHSHGQPVENLDYDRLTGSPEMHALFYGALSQYPNLPETLDAVMVGLPLETLSGEDARRNANAVRRWLKGEHSWTVDGGAHSVEIKDVMITPQPVGALFDYVLDEDAQFVPGRKKALLAEVGVVSIGFNTIELLVIRNRTPADRLTAGRTLGVRRLLELADGEGLYTLGEMDDLLRRGRLDVRNALPVWEREVLGAIEKKWARVYRKFEKVIIVGGGAVLLQNALLRRFGGKAFVPDNPVIATARGLYKIALWKNKKRRG